ncbi:MAG: PilZ domain-containing protein [bacterium]|nr:PilZ domain-containing protein [bacterium]
MDDDAVGRDDQRTAARMDMRLPIQARVGEGEHINLEMVDISASGMQIRSPDFDVLKRGFDAQHNSATFEIRIIARLAWARPEADGTFVTGWEFDRIDDEPRIG